MSRAPTRMLPPAEFLRSILEYNAETGDLFWKCRGPECKRHVQFNAKYAGKKAGGLSVGRDDGDNKYWVVGFRFEDRYQQYPAHRVIWKIVTGDDPLDIVDHRDGDNFNNRWLNLRPADNGKNLQNAKLRRDNKTGTKGVSWCDERRRFIVQVTANKRIHRIGSFKTIVAATSAANAARARLHGEFARTI